MEWMVIMNDEKMLRRLETLIDVVFALVIWKIFMILPRPSVEELEMLSIAKLVVNESSQFIIATVSILMVIVYWHQNNQLFKYLKKTNPVHTGLSIANLFLLLLFLYSVGLSIRFEGDEDALTSQSITALLYGLSTFFTWRYAVKKKLTHDELSLEDAKALSKENLAEPVTALFSLPFAIATPILWELSWFAYPLINKLFRGKISEFAEKSTEEDLLKKETP